MTRKEEGPRTVVVMLHVCKGSGRCGGGRGCCSSIHMWGGIFTMLWSPTHCLLPHQTTEHGCVPTGPTGSGTVEAR